jgi:hypothetical protein
MNIGVFILIILGIILIKLFIETKPDYNNYETFNSLGKVCDPPILLKEVFDENGLTYNKTDNDYYFPCTYDTCEADALAISMGNISKDKKIFLIDGCDVLASKLDLWKKLKNYFGKDADKYMPRTYLLEEESFNNNFREHFLKNLKIRNDHMYVLKNYKQRQEGIKITSSLNEITNGLNNGWFLVQDYVYNPYIIADRKINLRYYLLIVCHKNKLYAYLYNDGFVYYTRDIYNDKDMSFNKHVTTGYIDRKIYDTNPLTIQDFIKYLEINNKDSSYKLTSSTTSLMKNIMKALDGNICSNKKLEHYKRFQLFGCDVAPDISLEVKLMEINKGPDIGAKDIRDKILKKKLLQDIINIIEDKMDYINGFNRIY